MKKVATLFTHRSPFTVHRYSLVILEPNQVQRRSKMAEMKYPREQLILRRDQINEQLGRVNAEQRIELDRDPEEQAIQIEHTEVATAMEASLRRELAAIEELLLED